MAEENFLPQFRQSIEKRIKEQITRHRSVDPTVDTNRIIDIQIGQEKERLEKYLEQEENADLQNAYRALIDWLPGLAKTLKARH